MPDIFNWHKGGSPLIVSMPHSGTELPTELKARLTDAGCALADTDWHIPRLYNFLEQMDVTVVKANYSRYVVDLNRAPDGAALYPGKSETEICPTTSFVGEPLYRTGQALAAAEIQDRLASYWRPYHQKLAAEIARVKALHGVALLWDAHSIPSQVPRFFDGRLPDLNLGTVDGLSCDSGLSNRLLEVLQSQDEFSSVYNGRFKGGAITRQYGSPESGVHAVQMEIAQICYMNENPAFTFEERRADKLRPVLSRMIDTLLAYFPGG
jgi:N-formylglutamate deformylase